MKDQGIATIAFILLVLPPVFAAPDGKEPVATAASETPARSARLVAVEGADPPFAEILKSGAVKSGERFGKGPVPGSKVRVNHKLLEQQTGNAGDIPKDIGLHTQASGGISRKDFANWTRWYQEDGNVQIFRLFKGEQNIRGGTGESGSQGRVEAYSKSLKAGPDAWREWEGTYTIIKPVGACIFQLMHEGSLWPMHIDMDGSGGIHFLYRRPKAGQDRKIAMAQDMAGKSISIKVRANGTDYEVYQKDPLAKGPWNLVTKGSYTAAVDNKIQFRWGMYVGSKKGHAVPNDAMLLVNGVKIQ